MYAHDFRNSVSDGLQNKAWCLIQGSIRKGIGNSTQKGGALLGKGTVIVIVVEFCQRYLSATGAS